ncbi:MAG: DUF2953 domain-containing protein [Clostridium perfringens]|nr:DUF2953 domain-containing protein [Clostridium perfringens]
MKIFFILIILLIILFLPLPIIFEVSYNKQFKIYLYKKLKISLKNTPEKEIRTKKKSNKAKAKIKVNFQSILDSLQTNRFKPSLNLSVDMEYSLDDAALTAILYGVICGVLESVYLELLTIFNIKKKKYSISPLFNDHTSISFSVKGIIYLSIANIIYILFLYFSKEKHL